MVCQAPPVPDRRWTRRESSIFNKKTLCFLYIIFYGFFLFSLTFFEQSAIIITISPNDSVYFLNNDAPSAKRFDGGKGKDVYKAMRAWFLTGPNQMELMEVPDPQLKPGFLVAQVLTAQASVTETNMITLEENMFGMADRIKKEGKISLPGHEHVARVVAVNPGSKFKVGDRVSTLAKITCGHCEGCLHDEPRKCANPSWMGVTNDGMFSDYVLLQESGLVVVPEVLTNSEAANLQPLADCVAAVETTRLKEGDSVAIYGAGCLGMSTTQIVRAKGAGKVIVVDIKDENLELAKKLGATHTINGRNQDPIEAIRELTGGGADLIFDCAGGNPKKGLAGTVVLNQAIKSVRPEGELHILAMYGDSVLFPIGEARTYGKLISFAKFTTLHHMEIGAQLIAEKKLDVASMVTHVLYGLEKVPQMFEITGNKTSVKSLNPAQVVISE